ncbi:MAG: 50S ribosomal protein L23 [Dehalococcoidia bacterium]
MNPAKVLLRPLVTEKSTLLQEKGKYVFQVDNRATKHDVARAVKWAFDVEAVGVNTFVVKGKVKRYGRRPSKQPDWKKAIVTLRPGDTIQLFEGA